MALNQITQAHSLIRFLGSQRIDGEAVEGGDEIRFACPVCCDEKPRAYINARTGLWICFRCRARGSFFGLCFDGLQMSRSAVAEAFRAVWGRSKPSVLAAPSFHRPAAAAAPTDIGLPQGFIPERGGGLAHGYFTARGIEPELAPLFHCGYCLWGPYRYRVVVPVYTGGALRTWIARDITGQSPKRILTPPGAQAAKALFPYDATPENSEIVLVEGVFDALRIMSNPTLDIWPLATLGAHLSDHQRRLLRKLRPRRIVLLRDADEAGIKAALNESRELRLAGMEVAFARLPAGRDPAASGNLELLVAINSAIPIRDEHGSETLKEVLHVY